MESRGCHDTARVTSRGKARDGDWQVEILLLISLSVDDGYTTWAMLESWVFLAARFPVCRSTEKSQHSTDLSTPRKESAKIFVFDILPYKWYVLLSCLR